jgi:hypothetical protein
MTQRTAFFFAAAMPAIVDRELLAVLEELLADKPAASKR